MCFTVANSNEPGLSRVHGWTSRLYRIGWFIIGAMAFGWVAFFNK